MENKNPLDNQENSEVDLSNEEIDNISTVVEKFTLEHDPNDAAEYLIKHPKHINEFCLKVVEKYPENDRFTPALEIASVMTAIVEKTNEK